MGNKIVLIEDNKMNSRLAQKVLESAGMEVFVYSNAEEALSGLNGIRPSLVLVDLQLPGISGYDFVRQVRRFEKYAGVPLVAISANVREEDKSKAYAAGCDGFIEKPMNTRTLVRDLQDYLSG